MIGYHGTGDMDIEKIIEDILNNGYKSNERDDHWLGQGIYFFEDEFWAYQWCNQKKFFPKKKCVLKSEIDYKEDKFWDLDIVKFKKKFVAKAEKIRAMYKEVEKEIIINDEKKLRCFFLDLIKEEEKLEVIKCSFPLERNINSFLDKMGISNFQVQLCVTNNENIKNTCVYAQCECEERMEGNYD